MTRRGTAWHGVGVARLGLARQGKAGMAGMVKTEPPRRNAAGVRSAKEG